ncbi:maltokinase N-terminal cap-like domain-containing protein, partial [Streptomyces sp. URMC 123]|uniref:maltokinase N-terminal cap-like domain-containing protein n=1 Tax=Streptomyces sp. URMC 123 TaxID=3423403 RepID=UPI003F1C6B81
MSDGFTRANPTRATTPSPLPPPARPGSAPDPLPSLVPLLLEWLPRQRWFAGKGTALDGLTPVATTELLPCPANGAAPGLLHLLVQVRRPGVPEGHGQPRPHAHAPRPAEPADCYQLLLGVRAALPPPLAPALIGRPADGPLGGLAVYEALHDARLTAVLLERLRVPGRLGALRFTREPGAAIPGGLVPRPLGAEQSNSSVVYGDSRILKIFRRVGRGINPDLELPLALARTGCDRVPPPTAWFEAEPPGGALGDEPLTLGILQPFLPGSADGWRLALDALASGADFAGQARDLGRATAEVHTALARALPTAELRGPQLAAIAAGMAERLAAAAEAVPALRPYRGALHAVFDEVAGLGRAGRAFRAQRTHGDLHLGQALRTGDGHWTLIDFEGEPARPMAERRRPHPVARDIAGMLRSFDYAARAHRPAAGEGEERARAWARRGRAAYCDGYAEAAGADPREDAALLRAYETDKAVYEVLYEARHRPDWLPVPLAAVRRL